MSKYDSLEPLAAQKEFCGVCKSEILTMSFKGTGVCGENCRKRRDKETPDVPAEVTEGHQQSSLPI